MPAPTAQPAQRAQAVRASSPTLGMLAQLKLPGGLRAPGVLTDKRFTRKKDRFLSR